MAEARSDQHLPEHIPLAVHDGTDQRASLHSHVSLVRGDGFSEYLGGTDRNRRIGRGGR
jgi:hypothetical protein